MAALRDRVVATEIVDELKCSTDFNALAWVRSGVKDLDHLLRLPPMPSEDEDLESVQSYTHMVW